MATAKTDRFPAEDVQLAEWAKALGHPARVAILKVLAARRTCICGEIVEVLPLAQATVSQHLKALKEAGLVVGEVEGPRMCYGINWETMRLLQQCVEGLFTGLDAAAARCC